MTNLGIREERRFSDITQEMVEREFSRTCVSTSYCYEWDNGRLRIFNFLGYDDNDNPVEVELNENEILDFFEL